MDTANIVREYCIPVSKILVRMNRLAFGRTLTLLVVPVVTLPFHNDFPCGWTPLVCLFTDTKNVNHETDKLAGEHMLLSLVRKSICDERQ